MYKTNRNLFTVLLVLISLVGVSSSALAQQNIFSYDNSGQSMEPVGAILAKYGVKIDSSMLSGNFTLNLPSGNKSVTAAKETLSKGTSKNFSTNSYSGEISGSNGLKGNYQIAVSKGADGKEGISGNIKTAEGELYIIKQKSDQTGQELIKIDENNQIECHGAAHSALNLNHHSHASEVSATAESTINVLVAYTPDAIVTAGSEAALQSLIATMVSNTNLAHSNSQTGVTYSLVATYALSESSNDNFSQELSAATDLSDGKWDELATLRNQYCADQVVVIVGGTNGNTICGIAWLGGSADSMSFYEGQMFSVVSANQSICSYLTFAHELGHNLGSDHDYANSGQSAAYSYSYGHRFTGNSGQFRTVMAYSPGTRIPYFSNPRLTYDGAALGTSSADNAGSISLTAPVVSQFRGSDPQCASVVPPSITVTPAPTSAPATQPDSVVVSARKKSGKIIFDSGAYNAGTPLSDVTLSLLSDKKATGSFAKVVKQGRTNANGIKSFKIEVKSTSFYKVCYAGTLCSGNVKVRVTRKRRK